MNLFANYQYFFPKKVCRCPCILLAIEQYFDSGDYSLADILQNQLKIMNLIFSTRVGDAKENSLIVCANHLIVVLLATRRYTNCITQIVLQMMKTL